MGVFASGKNGNHSQARTEQELNGCARRCLAMPRGSNSRYAFRGLEDSHGSFPHRGHHGGFPQREKEWWIQNVLARDLSQDGRVGYQGWCAAGRQGDHQGFLYGRRHGWRSCGFRCWRWWWRLPSVCDGSVHLHGDRAGYRKCQGWCYAICIKDGQKRASRDSTQEVLQSPSVKQPTGRPVKVSLMLSAPSCSPRPAETARESSQSDKRYLVACSEVCLHAGIIHSKSPGSKCRLAQQLARARSQW